MSTATEVSNGQCPFSFSNVPDGRDYLISSSDDDDDFQLLDPGEAIGAYPSITEITAINVSSDRTGLRFTTEVRADLNSAALESTERGKPPLNTRQEYRRKTSNVVIRAAK